MPYGAIIAGGRNTRYGDLKAFAIVHGRTIIERVRAAVSEVTPDLILIANDEAYNRLGLPLHPDRVSGAGALAGLHSALHEARDEGRPGILAVACDMPFVSSTLLRELVQRAEGSGADAVLPESNGRRGLEPLCAYYSVRCLPAIEHAIARGDVRMISFHAEVNVARVPLAEVRTHGDPATIFLNVNTTEERERAELLARELEA